MIIKSSLLFFLKQLRSFRCIEQKWKVIFSSKSESSSMTHKQNIQYEKWKNILHWMRNDISTSRAKNENSKKRRNEFLWIWRSEHSFCSKFMSFQIEFLWRDENECSFTQNSKNVRWRDETDFSFFSLKGECSRNLKFQSLHSNQNILLWETERKFKNKEEKEFSTYEQILNFQNSMRKRNSFWIHKELSKHSFENEFSSLREWRTFMLWEKIEYSTLIENRISKTTFHLSSKRRMFFLERRMTFQHLSQKWISNYTQQKEILSREKKDNS